MLITVLQQIMPGIFLTIVEPMFEDCTNGKINNDTTHIHMNVAVGVPEKGV